MLIIAVEDEGGIAVAQSAGQLAEVSPVSQTPFPHTAAGTGVDGAIIFIVIDLDALVPFDDLAVNNIVFVPLSLPGITIVAR